MLGYHGLSEYDTTGAQPGADWRVYLAFHPVARQIIGDDVYRFEVGSLGAWDANMEQRCVDFVVRRAGGTDVRLHHGSVKGTVSIFGQLADWLSDARAAPLPPAPAVSRGLIHRDRDGFHGLASGVKISRATSSSGSTNAWRHGRPAFLCHLPTYTSTEFF